MCHLDTQECTFEGAPVVHIVTLFNNTSHHINRNLTNGQNKVHLHGELQNEKKKKKTVLVAIGNQIDVQLALTCFPHNLIDIYIIIF